MTSGMRILAFLVCAALLPLTSKAADRDQINIVGSANTVPLIRAVAEYFGQNSHFHVPVIEAAYAGDGFEEFCKGVGPDFADLAVVPRPINDSERALCTQNGIAGVTEIKIGYDGVVLASKHKGPVGNFTRKQLFLALARQVPVDGKLVDNPYQKWSDIDPALSAKKIAVIGPPPTSSVYDSFVELVMKAGCTDLPVLRALDEESRKATCGQIRADGRYIDAGEDRNLIIQKLVANPENYGIFGHKDLEENETYIQAALIEDKSASVENIINGRYPVARALFIYIKDQHVGVMSGLGEFLNLLASEKSLGDEGLMADGGMVPLPQDRRTQALRAMHVLLNSRPQMAGEK